VRIPAKPNAKAPEVSWMMRHEQLRRSLSLATGDIPWTDWRQLLWSRGKPR
jgi:hypothetical protein